MWLFNLLPGIESFGVFLALECMVSLLFIYWIFIDGCRE